MQRTDFADADLEKLIALGSRDGTRRCELTILFLGNTLVTDAGVCRLAACTQLRQLALPTRAFSDEAIAAVTHCRQLELLLLDERPLSENQLAALRSALPQLKLNGRTWQQREQGLTSK